MNPMTLFAAGLALASLLSAADFRAGVGRVKITPEKPVYLVGYVTRTHPSEGVIQDLWAKSLALEDGRRGRMVIVTIDIAIMPRELAGRVAERAQKEFGLERRRLLLNVSHTHTGPFPMGTHPVPNVMFSLKPEELETIRDYTRDLEDKLVSVIGESLRSLGPANLSSGQGQAPFAMNRREKTPRGVRVGPNPGGPVDHSVPVLRVTAADGKLLAVLFGYACHNTTLEGDCYRLSGDYAGFAQSGVEQAHPGATALFMALCGADQNPQPRGKLELAEQHGATLAAEVNRVLDGNLQRVRGTIRPEFRTIDLPYAPYTRETFTKNLTSPNPMAVRVAQYMLRAFDGGEAPRSYPYPVQAVGFGKDLAIAALGGEVVVEYALQLKKEFGDRTIVAGYSNDVMAYIPTVQILKEGGHEGRDAMPIYGNPGQWDESVESRILTAAKTMLRGVSKK